VCFRDGCLGVSSKEAPEEGLLNSPHNNIARGLQRTHEAAIEPAGVAEYLTFVVCAPLCFTIQIQATYFRAPAGDAVTAWPAGGGSRLGRRLGCGVSYAADFER
jgi:hypothetical protein